MEEFLEIYAKLDEFYYITTDLNGKISGIFNLENIKNINPRKLSTLSIKDLKIKDILIVDSNEKLSDLVIKLLGRDFVFVSDSGKIIGYLTPARILNFARFHNILEKGKNFKLEI